MPETTPQNGVSTNASAGHLSVHVEGAHPPDVPFLFEQQQKRLGPAFLVSAASHVAVFGLLLWLMRFSAPTSVITAPVLPDDPNTKIVWLSVPGPGGGGGGGGNRMKEPPRVAELPGKDKITVPAVRPAQIAPLEQPKVEPKVDPEPAPQVNIPAQTMAAALDSLPGIIDVPTGPPSPSPSQGSGSGGGAGTGRGTGVGSGTGSGLGDGSGGGTGGGVYRPGNGVTLPRIIREVKPQYTSDAMRAKVQGSVFLQCLVRPDGSVSDIQVVRSLDSTFGLDQEAIKAARQWRFAPGTRLGEPVPVLISIELSFNLR